MKEDLITFETAKLAQEKKCELIKNKTYYASFSRHHDALSFCENYVDMLTYTISEGQDNEGSLYSCSIILNSFDDLPTQSLLQKWLREVHGILVLVSFDKDIGSDEIVFTINWDVIKKLHKGSYSEKTYNTYEQALEIGLQEALKLI